ncbi:glutathione S-transferase family protein [Phenylobacterium sp.]|jgi:glutathione S-transferase|uniref:glutathione S-transferase family protein n=1 Tax=Phenylobacterium sp. TaxID=1871053 RepID=UPI003783AD5A
MTLVLHGHPLSSYCWKALIALKEIGEPYTFKTVNLGNIGEREAFLELSPLGKMPALVDGDEVLFESTTIIEHLARRHTFLLPPESAAQVRHWDRMFDLYCHTHLQRLVDYKLRPEGNADRYGVAETKRKLTDFYDLAERHMTGREWAVGEGVTLADCAAFPALHYADRIVAIGAERPNLSAYLARLTRRPSVQAVLEGAEPYAHFFPGGPED